MNVNKAPRLLDKALLCLAIDLGAARAVIGLDIVAVSGSVRKLLGIKFLYTAFLVGADVLCRIGYAKAALTYDSADYVVVVEGGKDRQGVLVALCFLQKGIAAITAKH